MKEKNITINSKILHITPSDSLARLISIYKPLSDLFIHWKFVFSPTTPHSFRVKRQLYILCY